MYDDMTDDELVDHYENSTARAFGEPEPHVIETRAETQSAAPALTDDEIDTGVAAMIVALARARVHPGGYEDRLAHGRAVIAAVVARAKREERGMIAHLIDGEMDVLTEDGQPLSSDEAAEYDALSRVRGYMQEPTR